MPSDRSFSMGQVAASLARFAQRTGATGFLRWWAAELAPLVLGEPAETALYLAERRLPADHRDLRGLEIVERRGRGREGQPPLPLGVEGVAHLGGVHGRRV